MQTFIESVLEQLDFKTTPLSQYVFILPNKRAGVYLKQHIVSTISTSTFAPQIISIEEFTEQVSGITSVSNTQLLFKFYDVYKTLTPKESIEDFSSFSLWAQVILQDFNEIDRFLIPTDKLFDYLKAIKDIEHWSVEPNSTELIKSHIKLWNHLKIYHLHFTKALLENNEGYQGLVYRKAADVIDTYATSTNKIHIFLGFNALNAAEIKLFQSITTHNKGDIFWDIDNTFLQQPQHAAGLFINSYSKQWPLYRNTTLKTISKAYQTPKHIKVIGIPKPINQAKYIGHLIDKLSTSKVVSNTAVVLGEEHLLLPVLNSLPETVKHVNVTMGMTLQSVPLSHIFSQLFSLHKQNTSRYYYKDILNIIESPYLSQLEYALSLAHISTVLKEQNNVYVTYNELITISNNNNLVALIFKPWNDNPETALKCCNALIGLLQNSMSFNAIVQHIELEFLYRFHTLFNELQTLNATYQHITTVASLYNVYKELLASASVDFRGEPLQGLQIMGMLESRVLDFETVIISGVNEGILPAGKSQNSFIPFDVKVENGLPTFKEKDAVYTYHFYRLLQRAKHVYILYNTEIDALKGGEKSRFITQLDVENIHTIHHTLASPNVSDGHHRSVNEVKKTAPVLQKIKALANYGFSPSSLTNYIRNPINFYYQKVLGVKEFNHIEEQIAKDTFGSVLHNTLEDFYKPLEGQLLTVDYLEFCKTQIQLKVTQHLKALYNNGDFTKGKNFIIFKILQRYIFNFLNNEIQLVKHSTSVEIIAIEVESVINIGIKDLNFPVKLKGKVDRIDCVDGQIRIIDYKSGLVEQRHLNIKNWDKLITDYDTYSKSFQVLCYAYMMYRNSSEIFSLHAGIISFRNLKEGFLKFSQANGRQRNYDITIEVLKTFEIELVKLITEICNPELNFIEKELNNDYL